MYSTFPGRWGTPLSGTTLVGVFLAAGHLGNGGSGGQALAVLCAGLVLVAVAAWWLARYGVMRLPLNRREGVNLVAIREMALGEGVNRAVGRAGAGESHCEAPWFMAHLDSKSQPVPIAVRAAGIVATGMVMVLALAYSLSQLVGAVDGSLWLLLTGIGVLSALPIAASTVGSRSPGALDNATGVAAVLLAAAALPREAACRVCITSAEELGLAGARAWVGARSGGKPQPVWNVDTLDDAGTTQAMWSGRMPRDTVARLAGVAGDAGGELRVRRVIPGILTDGVAVADAGWPAVTLSRGSARTLLRVHSARDRPELLTGEGVAAVAALIARAADTTGVPGP